MCMYADPLLYNVCISWAIKNQGENVKMCLACAGEEIECFSTRIGQTLMALFLDWKFEENVFHHEDIFNLFHVNPWGIGFENVISIGIIIDKIICRATNCKYWFYKIVSHLISFPFWDVSMDIPTAQWERVGERPLICFSAQRAWAPDHVIWSWKQWQA